MKTRSLTLLIVFSASVFASAQPAVQPVGDPAPPSKLQQYETTYVDNLKLVHAPLLQQYLGELKAMMDKAPATDVPAIKAEIARVQRMVTEGGIIEMSNIKPPPSVATGPAGSGIIFTLEPHEAQPPQLDDKPVPIGEASWTLSKLPAGNYDVIAHYSCEKLSATPSLKISFNGQDYTKELRASNVTKNGTTFRVLRMCQLRIKEEATFQKFTVTTPAAKEPWLFVKQILIVKAKEPK